MLNDAQYKYIAAQQNLETLQKGPTQNEINEAKAAVNQAQDNKEAVENQLKTGVVTAPISGTITALNTSVGATTVAGVPMVTVTNEGNLYVSANLPLEYLADFPQGKSVNINIPDVPALSNKIFTGKVTYVDSVLNQKNDEVLVKVSIDNPDNSIIIGMFAEIALKK